jgi:cell division protein FtsQ
MAVLVAVSVNAVVWFKEVKIDAIEFYGYSGGAENNRGVSQRELETLVKSFKSERYWQVDLHAMKHKVEQHPWVRSAVVRREWPDRLKVGVDEHVVIARWNEQHLLTATADLIEDENAILMSSLPHFIAPKGLLFSNQEAKLMVERYNQMQKILGAYQQRIVQFGMTASNDVWLTLATGGRVELGRVDHTIRLQRLIGLVEQNVVSSWSLIASADMRYRQGASIRWSDLEVEEELESLVPLVENMSVLNQKKLFSGDMHG